MDSKKTEDLLDLLARQADCAYLSELRNPAYYNQVADALKGIDADAYSVREWQDAASYIVGEKLIMQNSAQACEMLCQKLREAVSVTVK